MKEFKTGSLEVTSELTLKQWDEEQENMWVPSLFEPWIDRAPSV